MDLVKEDNGLQKKGESPSKKEIDVKKKQLTLNLDSSKPRKRAVISNHINNNPNSITSLLDPQSIFWNSPMNKVILESPDVQMLKMHTPDVEKFLMQSNLNSTPTPSLANRRFVETTQLIKQLGDLNNESLNNIQNNSNSDSSRPPSNASSNYQDNLNLQDDNSNATSLISGNNSNCSFNTSNNSANNQFNENADLDQIGMLKNQDLSKLERKRLRNR